MGRTVGLLGALLAGLLLVGVAGAHFSPDHDLSWHVIGSGGHESMASGSHRIYGTLGQLASGPAAGADHAVGAGYWYGVGRGFVLYLPILIKPQAP